MTKKEIIEWLTDVPDDAVLVAVPADEWLEDVHEQDATYTCELRYSPEAKKIYAVFGT